MTTWTKTVDISQHLKDNDTPLEVRANRIDTEFTRAGLYGEPHGLSLMGYVEELKEQAETGDPDYFDVPLSRIYDWCDANNVWCGA